MDFGSAQEKLSSEINLWWGLCSWRSSSGLQGWASFLSQTSIAGMSSKYWISIRLFGLFIDNFLVWAFPGLMRLTEFFWIWREWEVLGWNAWFSSAWFNFLIPRFRGIFFFPYLVFLVDSRVISYHPYLRGLDPSLPVNSNLDFFYSAWIVSFFHFLMEIWLGF